MHAVLCKEEMCCTQPQQKLLYEPLCAEIFAQLVYRPRADPLRIALIGLYDIDDLLGDYFIYRVGTGFEMK